MALLAGGRLGVSGALVLRGEAGIGKTALLDYALAQAGDCRVVQATGVEAESELAFAGLHQICAPVLDRLARLSAQQGRALSTAFGLSAGEAPDLFMVGLGVLGLLAGFADEQPVVCIVDDAQWLDKASAQVLGFVARRLRTESLIMIFAVRGDLDTDDMPELKGLPVMTVTGLSDEDSQALLASTVLGRVDQRVLERIIAECHGNPLALTEQRESREAPADPVGTGLSATLAAGAWPVAHGAARRGCRGRAGCPAPRGAGTKP
ncbi:AAA family ATPase [Micromonospora chokoriensis]